MLSYISYLGSSVLLCYRMFPNIFLFVYIFLLINLFGECMGRDARLYLEPYLFIGFSSGTPREGRPPLVGPGLAWVGTGRPSEA